jgi:hypothetical protein
VRRVDAPMILGRLREVEQRCRRYKKQWEEAVASREKWKAKAIVRGKQLELERNRVRQIRASRDLWRHRCMTDRRSAV